jgi:hypothetical protein
MTGGTSNSIFSSPLSVWIDWFRIRKYNNPEPTYAFGNEASPGANESEGDEAIVQGIQNALGSNVAIYPDQQVYIRYQNESLSRSGQFDWIAVSGNQTWMFNYITQNETYTNMQNMYPSVYVWEDSDLTVEEIINNISALINATKISNGTYKTPGSFWVFSACSLNFYY